MNSWRNIKDTHWIKVQLNSLLPQSLILLTLKHSIMILNNFLILLFLFLLFCLIHLLQFGFLLITNLYCSSIKGKKHPLWGFVYEFWRKRGLDNFLHILLKPFRSCVIFNVWQVLELNNFSWSSVLFRLNWRIFKLLLFSCLRRGHPFLFNLILFWVLFLWRLFIFNFQWSITYEIFFKNLFLFVEEIIFCLREKFKRVKFSHEKVLFVLVSPSNECVVKFFFTSF